MKNYYKILKVEKTASKEEIKRKYRELARTYHPDVSEEESAHDFFVEINEAYQILSDEKKRKRYDYIIENAVSKQKIRSYAAYMKSRVVRKHFDQWVEVARKKAQQEAKKQYKEYAKTINCYFYSASNADGEPYYFYLHKDVGVTRSNTVVGVHAMQNKIKYKNITIPIPRSKKAQSFHNIGFVIKLITLLFAIGIALGGYFKDTELLMAWGIVFAILLSGGLICHILYCIFRVKSLFYYAIRFPRVQEYIKKGFHSGAYTLISTSPFGLVLYAIRWLL